MKTKAKFANDLRLVEVALRVSEAADRISEAGQLGGGVTSGKDLDALLKLERRLRVHALSYEDKVFAAVLALFGHAAPRLPLFSGTKDLAEADQIICDLIRNERRKFVAFCEQKA